MVLNRLVTQNLILVRMFYFVSDKSGVLTKIWIALCFTYRMPDLNPNQQLAVNFIFFPYKTGTKTLLIDFDCSAFRDIKASHEVKVVA